MLFISGIVKVPVVTTFATELPDMVPKRPLAITATFAGPPILCPVAARARSMKNFPRPVLWRKAPNNMNRYTKVEALKRHAQYSFSRYIHVGDDPGVGKAAVGEHSREIGTEIGSMQEKRWPQLLWECPQHAGTPQEQAECRWHRK